MCAIVALKCHYSHHLLQPMHLLVTLIAVRDTEIAMQLRRQRNNRLIALVSLLAAALIIFVVGNRSGLLRPIRTLIMAPTSPIARVLNNGAESVTTEPDAATLQELQERNRQLERNLAEIQVEIVRLREIEQDYYRLSDILNYAAERPDESLVTGDVIAQDTSSYLKWVIINKGARDGVAIGDPVINELGLVGRVEEISANTSWVRLVIDPSSTVDGLVQNAQARGSVSGQIRSNLLMEFIPQEAVIETGDLVVTSGLGGTYPANIVLGQITTVIRETANPFQQAEMRPTVNFDDLQIVSVITNFEAIDTSVFDDTIEQQSEPQ